MINNVEVYNWAHYVPNAPFAFNGTQTNRLDPYLTLATQYGWANYMFQTNEGPSFPSHQFILSGTSAQTAPPNTFFAAENPTGPDNENDMNNTGCTSPGGETANIIDNSGSEDYTPVYPCFEHTTLTDLLNNAGKSWKWYADTTGSIWTAPNAIHHICNPIAGNTCNGQDWVKNVAPYIGTGKVLLDLGVNGVNNTACQLPAVSWVIPDGAWSDHAGTGKNSAGYAFGPAWVADIVDAVGGYDNTGAKLPIQCYDVVNGQHVPYWQNTAILITWDDWGGWYDHVEPFSVLINTDNNCTVWGCGYVYGFRVPFMFVSAYTPQGFVSGTVSASGNTCIDTLHCYDFGSILQFIELNFGLKNIGGQNQYADFFAKSLDPTFYNSQFRQFQAILTPVPQNCFINPSAKGCFANYTGPVDPDDDEVDPTN